MVHNKWHSIISYTLLHIFIICIHVPHPRNVSFSIHAQGEPNWQIHFGTAAKFGKPWNECHLLARRISSRWPCRRKTSMREVVDTIACSWPTERQSKQVCKPTRDEQQRLTFCCFVVIVPIFFKQHFFSFAGRSDHVLWYARCVVETSLICNGACCLLVHSCFIHTVASY